MLGKIETRRRGWQRNEMVGAASLLDPMDMSLSILQDIVRSRKPDVLLPMGQNITTTEQQTTWAVQRRPGVTNGLELELRASAKLRK